MDTVGAYFNQNWQRYLNTIKNNTLYHKEMLHALDKFLATTWANKEFTFADVGCGDARTVFPILSQYQIKKYIGIDAAPDVLKMAEEMLAPLKCDKEFMAENMCSAITHLSSKVDIIYTSFAVHHLSLQEKTDFIAHCYEQLNSEGYLLLIDGVLSSSQQTRAEWLDVLQGRIAETHPEIDESELITRMEHPRAADFPESIKTFTEIAQRQSWSKFEVLFQQDIFAFMLFKR
jgi:SAM-dependent methyltransferase